MLDDRHNIQAGDQVVLIIEDDTSFAQLELELARSKGMKGLIASRGKAALALAREYAPAGILLDISLPDIDGWKVLDRLKGDLTTRHIPVFVISVADEPQNALKQGALRFFTKPIKREDLDDILERIQTFREKPRKLLVVEDDEIQRNSIRELIGNGTAKLTPWARGKRRWRLCGRRSTPASSSI